MIHRRSPCDSHATFRSKRTENQLQASNKFEFNVRLLYGVELLILDRSPKLDRLWIPIKEYILIRTYVYCFR